MYPVLFRIGDFEITSFGVTVGVAALVGIWVFSRELRRSGLPADAVNAAIGGVIGGLVGAKLPERGASEDLLTLGRRQRAQNHSGPIDRLQNVRIAFAKIQRVMRPGHACFLMGPRSANIGKVIHWSLEGSQALSAPIGLQYGDAFNVVGRRG